MSTMESSTSCVFRNFEELVAHGQSEARRDALRIVGEGILGGDPGRGTRRLVRRDGDLLYIEDDVLDLREYEHVYVVGSGKGAFPIAEALEETLGDRIDEGVVVVKKGEKRRLERIEVFEAGHPIPDAESVEGARRIVSLLGKLRQNDLVFAAITGGCSALTTLPPDGVALSEIGALTDMLLKCGAIIQEINAVRKHLCLVKGGRLAERFHPARAFTLTLNTAPEGMPWPDMCLPDPTTFQDAVEVLKRFDIWNRVSSSIVSHLEKGLVSPEMETPKNLDGVRNRIISVADPWSMCESAASEAKRLGYIPAVLGVKLEGEAKELGCFFAGIAKEVAGWRRPFPPPCAIISGGETTVTIRDNPGRGGPNQETVLGFANKFRDVDRQVVCISVDSDGTDGPTDIAGGIADAQTYGRVAKMGLRIDSYLKEHNSAELLEKLGDTLVTGHTGTNLMNLRLVLVK